MTLSTLELHRWHTLTQFDPMTVLSLRSKFDPPDIEYPPGPINSSPCLLSYHYKQRLRVDVSMHRAPVSRPAGGHSKEVVHCDGPPTMTNVHWLK